MPDLTNALVAEWKQIPTAMFHHLVESLPRRVEAVIAAKGDQLHINAHDFGMRCWMSRCLYTFGHVVYVRLMWSVCLSHLNQRTPEVFEAQMAALAQQSRNIKGTERAPQCGGWCSVSRLQGSIDSMLGDAVVEHVLLCLLLPN